MKLALLLALIVAASAEASQFEKRVFRRGTADALPYRLFVPPGYDAAKRYPLVLWLHGGAGRGTDNEKQIAGGNRAGATVWTQPRNQARWPAFVVAPQCPEGATWKERLPQVVALVRELRTAYGIDPERVYVAGQSMGGYGVWAALAAHPELFAAAVTICGGGDASQASRIARVPVWVFHGARDRAVPVEYSRQMVAAVRRAGGEVRYTEYKRADHVVWNKAFAEPELLPWVFAQRRHAKSSEQHVTPPSAFASSSAGTVRTSRPRATSFSRER